ncbi:MAG: BMP family ABC transporter substrate-binding protein, partial [Alphaproteobacteria bacterium]|nr:BMP family ABC transporter substrate-binding protein [Alphaproteobacteria bacterium]
MGLAVVLAAAMAFVGPALAQNAMRPAIVYSTGGKSDQSFNENASKAVGRFK